MSAMMTASLIPELTAGNVHVIEKTSPFEGYFRVDRYRLKHRLFEGGWTAEMNREVFERGYIVAVLLYDPELDRVVLIEQFRPGAYAALASEWFSDYASPWLVDCVSKETVIEVLMHGSDKAAERGMDYVVRTVNAAM